MPHILNWPLIDSYPVVIGYYIDEPYGIMMPREVWKQPVATIDGKLKRYYPRGLEGWSQAFNDLKRQDPADNKVGAMQFWIALALANSEERLVTEPDEDGDDIVKAVINKQVLALMKAYNDPDVMLITGEISNFMALLQYQTTWPNLLYHHENFYPVEANLLAFLFQQLSNGHISNFSAAKMRAHIIGSMEEDEDGNKPVETMDQNHLKVWAALIHHMPDRIHSFKKNEE